MKKDKRSQAKSDEIRPEYKPDDFPAKMARGKYTKRLKEASNVVVLSPEVAAVFQTDEEVNNALLSLIKLAKATMGPRKRGGGRSKTRAA